MITVKKDDNGKFRLYDGDKIAISAAHGKPIDGGGHDMHDKADRQAGYINAALKKAEDEKKEAKGG